VYDGFIQIFKDKNPLHVNDKYAQSYGFNKKVMHGAILNGFISHFIGMIMPGRNATLLSSDIRHHSPCYINDELLFSFTLNRKVEATRMLLLTLLVYRFDPKKIIAKGKIQVLFRK